MGVTAYGASNSSLSTLPAWAQSVAAAFDNSDTTVNTRIAAAVPATWSAYAPSMTGTGFALGSGGSQVGRYIVINGKTVIFHGTITFGTGLTIGTGPHSVTLPSPAAYTTAGIQPVNVRLVAGSSYYMGAGEIYSSTQFYVKYTGTNGAETALTSTAPFTWAATNTISFSGVYEVA
jgi:hypothetical protein